MRFRVRYADVAATLALVISLGGTAYAATLITSSNIQDNTILSQDVRDGTLQGVDVKDGTITRSDINDLTEAALKGQKGDPGIQGEPGLQGDPGTDGINGVSGYQVVLGSETFGTVNDTITAFAMCPAGKKPLSGGWLSGANNLPLDVKETHPRTLSAGEVPAFPAGGEAWQVNAREVWSTNGSTANWYLRVWAVCATVS
jgi:hypothetical protein